MALQGSWSFNEGAGIVAVDTFKGSVNEETQTSIAKQAGGSFRHLFNATLAQAGVLQMVPPGNYGARDRSDVRLTAN